MCAPDELKQRVSPDEFDRFRVDGLTLYIQRDLLGSGEIHFDIAGSGAFHVTLAD